MAQTGAGNRTNVKPTGGSSMLAGSKPKAPLKGVPSSIAKPGLSPLKTQVAPTPGAPAARAAAAPLASPIQRGVFGGGGGGGVAPDAQIGAGPVGGDDDYLAGDSSYQLQLAALMKALSDGNADFDAQSTRYTGDYNDALKGLGWMQDDPATADVNESKWNFDDTNTAAGRAFQNQNNDFASRGLLQSSLYGTANDNLTRSLNDQLGSVNTAKTNFFDDLTKKRTGLASDNQLSQQQARAEALARRAGGIQL